MSFTPFSRHRKHALRPPSHSIRNEVDGYICGLIHQFQDSSLYCWQDGVIVTTTWFVALLSLNGGSKILAESKRGVREPISGNDIDVVYIS